MWPMEPVNPKHEAKVMPPRSNRDGRRYVLFWRFIRHRENVEATRRTERKVRARSAQQSAPEELPGNRPEGNRQK
jgi:hypothetical protein